MAILLQIRGLQVAFRPSRAKTIRALCGAELSMEAGEVLGVLGESGSGKSTLARALLGLLPKSATVTGRVEFEGRNLLQLGERAMRKLRGARVCWIPQAPSQALNPVMRVGSQVAEIFRVHRKWTWQRCREEAEQLLERMWLDSSERRLYHAYPHQLSGGQQQRVVIAQALACQPALVIADEPTASLDATVESEILQLLSQLKAERKLSLLFITHDPSILSGLADRVAVMYAGRVVEDGRWTQVFGAPRHPYTRALLNCAAPIVAGRELAPGARLPTVPGAAPDPQSAHRGCSFAPRCGERLPTCESRLPVPVEVDPTTHVECFLYGC